VTVVSCQQHVHDIYKNVKLDMRQIKALSSVLKQDSGQCFSIVLCCIVASSSITGSDSQCKRASEKGDREGSGIVPGLATRASEELCANPVITKLQR
jgi:hypothetical protein